jgi:hypothetical protein
MRRFHVFDHLGERRTAPLIMDGLTPSSIYATKNCVCAMIESKLGNAI